MKQIQLIIFLAAFLAVAQAQEIPPELTQLKTPYQQVVTTIWANAEIRAKPFVTSCLAALDRMLTQVAKDPGLSAPHRPARADHNGERHQRRRSQNHSLRIQSPL